METSKRVFYNTGFLYGRMLITLVISLYSTRLILSALGQDDFGIFNVVAGVIGMLNFLNGAMTVSTQRYLSYFIGAENLNKLKSVFSSSLLLHLALGLLIVVLLEGAGLFLFDGFLNIPPERMGAAKTVYHFMILGAFFTFVGVPFDGAINAHEHLFIEALAGVVEAFAKLGIALWLIKFQNDKLILYGLLMASLIFTIRFLKGLYCYNKFKECKSIFSVRLDLSLVKEMFSFAGWNLFGSFCHVLKNQGLAIVLNVYYSVIINAAYGIANQVNGQLTAFSVNMLKAVNPQIIKSEGGKQRDRMLRLAMFACKLSFYLMLFFALPLILEMEFVLKFWLKDVPETTVEFCRLVLIVSVLSQLTVGLRSAIQSVGRIKAYQVVVGVLLMLNIPAAILLIKLGLPSYSVIYGSIFLEVVAAILRIWFANKIAGLNILDFVTKIVIPSLGIVGLAAIIGYTPKLFMDEGIVRALVTGVFTTISIIVFGNTFALDKDEKEKITGLFNGFKSKFIKTK